MHNPGEKRSRCGVVIWRFSDVAKASPCFDMIPWWYEGRNDRVLEPVLLVRNKYTNIINDSPITYEEIV